MLVSSDSGDICGLYSMHRFGSLVEDRTGAEDVILKRESIGCRCTNPTSEAVSTDRMRAFSSNHLPPEKSTLVSDVRKSKLAADASTRGVRIDSPTHRKGSGTQVLNVRDANRKLELGRRWFLGAAQCLCTSGSTPRGAWAYLIDEGTSEKVFKKGSMSSVAVLLEKRDRGTNVFEGVGSGFVWDEAGHIVTNYHVVEKALSDKTGAWKVKVSPPASGADELLDEFEAQIVGEVASLDLAVLKINVDPSRLPAVQIGTSRNLRVGQWAFAIGNPYGLSNTLTCGIVSGLNRSFPAPNGALIRGALQTDASISRGNSGGPLLDSSGSLIGVNTATYTKVNTGRSSGVNFAIPVDAVSKAVSEVIAK